MANFIRSTCFFHFNLSCAIVHLLLMKFIVSQNICVYNRPLNHRPAADSPELSKPPFLLLTFLGLSQTSYVAKGGQCKRRQTQRLGVVIQRSR
jgi:hypothetical protein